jgi:hypothetical protein
MFVKVKSIAHYYTLKDKIVKIRWTKNSVRFRITPTELQKLERGEAIRESFPLSASWHAAIVPSSGVTELQFVDGAVQMSLNSGDIKVLSNPANEGVYFQTKDETGIRYFIEKDFPCAHPRAGETMEPVSETFSPPTDFDERKAS